MNVDANKLASGSTVQYCSTNAKYCIDLEDLEAKKSVLGVLFVYLFCFGCVCVLNGFLCLSGDFHTHPHF